MKNIEPWLCSAALALAFGCQSPAERVISLYASEEDCMDRLQYTIQPEADRAAFEREYPSGVCKTGRPNVDTRACSSIEVGETCFVTAEANKRVCVQRTSDDEFKIDWQCSTGYNEIPVKTYRAGSQNDAVVVLRLRVELSDYYNYHYSSPKGTHQSLRMSDRRNETLRGYVARSSEAARRLENLLARREQARSHAGRRQPVPAGKLRARGGSRAPARGLADLASGEPRSRHEASG